MVAAGVIGSAIPASASGSTGPARPAAAPAAETAPSAHVVVLEPCWHGRNATGSCAWWIVRPGHFELEVQGVWIQRTHWSRWGARQAVGSGWLWYSADGRNWREGHVLVRLYRPTWTVINANGQDVRWEHFTRLHISAVRTGRSPEAARTLDWYTPASRQGVYGWF
jgi:hypothetical protein